jgi:hypothetical protein
LPLSRPLSRFLYGLPRGELFNWYFCSEEFFPHELVFDRSSLTRRRNRMGEERPQVLYPESLPPAVKTEAIKLGKFSQVSFVLPSRTSIRKPNTARGRFRSCDMPKNK